MRAVDFTNDTHVIRSFRDMTAINSAIEVDLTGQVVADSIGYRMYSGVGGQMDFIRGAALAPGGRAIIALPSTAGADGSMSRITPAPSRGRGRRHHAGARPDRGHGVRRRGAVGQEPAGAGEGADRGRAPGPPRRAHRTRRASTTSCRRAAGSRTRAPGITKPPPGRGQRVRVGAGRPLRHPPHAQCRGVRSGSGECRSDRVGGTCGTPRRAARPTTGPCRTAMLC